MDPLAFQRFLRHPDERGWVEVRFFKPGGNGVANRGWLELPSDGSERPPPLDKRLEAYFGVLPRTSNQKGDAAHVGPGSVLWVELDLKDQPLYLEDWSDVTLAPPHVLEGAARNLMADVQDRCAELALPPRAIVYSGHGLHVYWGLGRLMDPKWIQEVVKGLCDWLGGDPASTDRARILRVPGSWNLKNRERPLFVSLWHHEDMRHDPAAFEPYQKAEVLPELPPGVARAFAAGETPWTPGDGDLRALIRGWASGERHALAMAFGGWVASHGVPQQVATDMVRRICHEAGDEELNDRLRAVETSYKRYLGGQRVLGWTALKGLVPQLQGRGNVLIGTLTRPATPDAPVTLPPEYREGEFGELYVVTTTETPRGLQEDEKLLASRMLWLDEVQTEAASGEMHLRVSWPTNDGEKVAATLPFGDAVTRQGLLRLGGRGAPVDELNAGLLTRYLQRYYAHNQGGLPQSLVSAHTGWHRERFFLPGDALVLGLDEGAWLPAGQREGWLEGLSALLSWGVTPALVAAALAAAAPAVRPLRLAKNPILALSTTSHTGKTTAVRFALSLWANPEYNESLYFDSVTVAGLMSRLAARQDLPLAFDDHQRYRDFEVAEMLHLLAGGAEKARAKRDGGERGARRWRGAAMLTGETAAVRETMGTGALNRLLELTDYPLGVPRGPEGYARSSALAQASAHHGAMRGGLLTLYAELPPADVAPMYGRWAVEQGAPADMGDTLGLIGYGVRLLEALAGHEDTQGLPERVVHYLTQKLAEQRKLHGSLAGRAFGALRDLLASFMAAEGTDEIRDGGKQLIAFRKTEGAVWYVNPEARAVVQALTPYGGVNQHLSEWAREGWIRTQDENGVTRHKVKVRYGGHQARWIALTSTEGTPDEA